MSHYVTVVDANVIPVDPHASASLDAADRLRHHVIMKAVMSDLRIPKDDVERRFQITFDRYFASELAQLEQVEADGLVTGVSGRDLHVTDLGRAFIRNIARVFDAY